MALEPVIPGSEKTPSWQHLLFPPAFSVGSLDVKVLPSINPSDNTALGPRGETGRVKRGSKESDGNNSGFRPLKGASFGGRKGCVQVSGGDGDSPFNVILIRLVGLVGCLDVVSLAHHSDITLYVTLQPSRDVVRV